MSYFDEVHGELNFTKVILSLFLFSVLSYASILYMKILVSANQPIQAATNTPSGPIRGQAGDLWADIILGKPDFSENVANTVVSNKFQGPGSIIMDRSVTPNRMYIIDGSNSRIIGISDASRCLSQAPNCQVNAAQGDIVIGQPNFNTAACNGDSGFQHYPNRAPASATSLCFIPEYQLSVGESGSGTNGYVSPQGDLYITDSFNHRVLKYVSPFTTDTIADDIWGQNDFTGNQCNKGQSSPDATTLCFGWSGNNNNTAGVDVDSNGNLWVADNGNHRVLRFPPGSHTADLVLGQPNFTSHTSGSGLNQLYAPAAVKVNAQGQVYVADYNNNRVLRYTNPQTGAAGELFGSGFQYPMGLEWDPGFTASNSAIWVAQPRDATFKLFKESDASLLRTLGKPGDGNVVNAPHGTLGIDSTGNYFVAEPGAVYGDDVAYFPANGPYDLPTQTLFNGKNTFNQRDQYGIEGGVDVTIRNNQLIIMDAARILFWNIDPNDPPSTLTNGKPADGVIIGNDFNDGSARNGSTVMKASDTHLYVGRSRHTQPARVDVYNLPLVTGAQPITTIYFPLNVLGGGQITAPSDQLLWGIAPAADDSYLWLSHSDGSRTFRLRNPLTNPLVDVILGQTNTTDTACNRTGNPGIDATANTLCWPGWLSLDKNNNLFLSDWSPENRGNWRELVFDPTTVPANNPTVIYAPTPSKIFINTAVAEVAFDSQNHMVAGYQRYFNLNPSSYEFPGIYMNPLAPAPNPPAQIQPDAHLNDYSSAAFGIAFDSQDNLYVADWSRSRVEIYKTPLVSATPSVTVSPIPVTNTPIPPTNTPVPTATLTPIPPTPTRTPTLAPALNISGVTTNNKTATSITIKWNTNHPGTSRVAYGTSSNNLNLSTIENTQLVTSHAVNLSNLLKNTTYYYRVYSKNASGVEYSSNLYNFKTASR